MSLGCICWGTEKVGDCVLYEIVWLYLKDWFTSSTFATGVATWQKLREEQENI